MEVLEAVKKEEMPWKYWRQGRRKKCNGSIGGSEEGRNVMEVLEAVKKEEMSWKYWRQ